MRSTTPVILLLMLISVAFVSPVQGQVEPVGPILANVWNRAIRVHDVGSNFEWVHENIDLRAGELIWSPDGCHLLIQDIMNQWIIALPFQDRLREIPVEDVFGEPLWADDGETIVLVSYHQDTDQSRLLRVDVSRLRVETFASLDGAISLRKSLSPQELLVQQDGYMRVLNMASLALEDFGSALYPRYPAAMSTPYHGVILSPDYRQQAAYHLPYYSFLGPDGSTEIDVDDLNVTPGIEVIDLNNGENQAFDLFGEYVVGMTWAPSSERLAVLTIDTPLEKFTFHLVIIDLVSGTQTKVYTYRSAYYPQYGGYLPSWSPDEKMITVQSRDGLLLYDLELSNVETIDLHVLSVQSTICMCALPCNP
ncbi:MAG: hypothetical protein AAFR22_12725 [Chloroflexota bacterium]